MRRALLITLLVLPAIAASAPLSPAPPADAALAAARAEAQAAAREVDRLTAIADKARTRAAGLGARKAAAAQAIVAAEADISAADAEGRLLARRLEQQRHILAERQAPAASLLAGVAMMAQRPPLLTLAAGGRDLDDMVRVRLLLDSTMPVIRARTAALSRDIARSRALEQALARSREALAARRTALADRQDDFAALETEARALAERSGTAALGAGDALLAGDEEVERLAAQSARARSARRVAQDLAALGEAPARPFRGEGRRETLPFTYALPAEAPVADGFGAVGATGIRTRGITLATRRGAAVVAPARGTIRFAGAYRGHDGVIIIDHGGGWTSLLLNAAPSLKAGDSVAAGAPIGRALGPLGVELSRNGRYWSPALIAGSSAALSKERESS